MMCDWLRKLRRSKNQEAQPPEDMPAEAKRVVQAAGFETDPRDTPILHNHEKPETIFVRGEYWKNTSETRWEFPQEQDKAQDDSLECLIKQLRRIDRAEYRRSAAETLGLRGPAATPAIPALVLSAVDADKSVREAALCALNKIDSTWAKRPETLKVVPSLVLALKSQSHRVPEAASRMLNLIGPSAVPDMVEALATKEDTIDKIFIIRVLARFGSDAAGAVPELSRALGSEHLQERLAAADALLKIGPEGAAALPELIVGLSDPYSDCRMAMVTCLANLEEAAEPSAPALVLLLADREVKVRQASATALEKIGPKSIPILVEFLQMRDVRRSDARQDSLKKIWTWATKPAPDIMVIDMGKAWANLSWWVTDMMEDWNRLEFAQLAALAVLARFGPAAGEATPAVAQALADPNPRIKLAAVLALGQIGPEASSAIPSLIRLMADFDRTILAAVQVSLENIDENWRLHPAVRDLIATLATRLSKGEIEGGLAVDMLTWVGAPAVPTLIDALRYGILPARINAAITLGQIGKDAREAIPALTEALQDENTRVRAEAANALRRINGKID
jgi:HEAT repeat protein